MGRGSGREESQEQVRNILGTCLLLRRDYGEAMALQRLAVTSPAGAHRRTSLERVFPPVEDLPRPDEDPRTGGGSPNFLT